MFSLLAGVHGVLCHDQGRCSRAREGSVSAQAGGLLRVPAPQERGMPNSAMADANGLIRPPQYARARAMQEALRKAERAHPRENAPKLGQIRSLGLLGHEEESKAIMAGAKQ